MSKSIGLSILIFVCFTAQSIHAANGTWTNDGSGIWGNTSNWNAGTIASGGGFTADFSTIDLTTTDRTVSLDSPRTIGYITFGDVNIASACGWILDNNGNAANILTLSGTNAGINVKALGVGKEVILSAEIAGNSGLTKTGAGILILSGTNTYTGTTRIYGGGTLRVVGGSLVASTGLIFGLAFDNTGGGTFGYDNAGAAGATTQTLASLSSQINSPNDNTVKITRTAAQNVALQFTTVAFNATENGNVINFVTEDIAGGGVNGVDYKIVFADQTEYRIIKQNAYFNGGDFAVYDTTAGTGLLGYVRGINYGTDPNSISYTAGQVITAGYYNVETSGHITGQTNVSLGSTSNNNNGTLKIKGASNITMTSGSLNFAVNDNSGANGILKTGGGTSTISGGTSVSWSSVASGGPGQADIRVDGVTDVLNIAMPLSYTTRTRIMKSGAGKLILSGATTYSLTDSRNTLHINGGVLEISGSATFNDTLGPIRIAPGANFRYNSTSSSSSIAAAISGAGGITVNAGILTLTGANVFTGQLSVESGTLKIDTVNNSGSSGPLGQNALAVILGNAGGMVGTMQYTGAGTSSSKKFTMATGGAGFFQIDDVNAILTLTGIVDGGGDIAKTGAGKLTLNGANSYSGNTAVVAGTLKLTSANLNNETSTVTIAETGATLELAFSDTDTVDKLFIGGIQMPAGTYGATGSGADPIHTDDSHFAGSGRLYVATGPPTFTLSLNASENGQVPGAGPYLPNSTVSLTATPSPGYVFSSWSGDASGSANPLSVLMDNHKTIFATFVPDTSDVDADGLNAYLEVVVYGTNPTLSDTDGDGIKDGAETNYSGSFYKLVQGSFNYQQAVADATAKHGRVAGFSSAADYERVAAKVRQTTQGYIWIGLSDAATEGTWVWTDGSTATYGRWLTGQPGGDTAENRVVISQNTTLWADAADDYVAAGYIFERVGLDPLNQDSDGDGLTDSQELVTTHSDPLLEDTDGDGLLDGEEVNTYVSSPLLEDTDSDGINDKLEALVYHTNPALRDTDGDGFDDPFEINTGFNPALADSTPDALSSLRTAVEFRFNAANGVSYRIEASTDLNQWSTVEPAVIGQSAVVTRFFSTENQPKRYFRVRRN